MSESVHGRLSGGILFLVKNVIAKHIKQVFVETDNILVLRISRELTGALTDSILVGAYLPPQNSAYYRDTDLSNGVEILEDCLLEITKNHTDTPLISFFPVNLLMCKHFNGL